MQRKFIPKIVPRVVPDSKPVTDPSGGAAESIFILRVKRRRDESAAEVLVVGRDPSDRKSKRLLTPEMQLARLSVSDENCAPVPQAEQTKIFKLIGTTRASEPLSFLGAGANSETSSSAAGAAPTAEDASSESGRSKILKRISEHCRLQQESRNVKRSDSRHSEPGDLAARLFAINLGHA